MIRSILVEMIGKIDSGTCSMTEEQARQVFATLREYNQPERMSKYQACAYLNISRATFDRLVAEGKLPKGKKDIGFKELSWNKGDLNEHKDLLDKKGAS